MITDYGSARKVYEALKIFEILPELDFSKVNGDQHRYYSHTHGYNVEDSFFHDYMEELLPDEANVAELFSGSGEESRLIQVRRPDCDFSCLDIDEVFDQLPGLQHVKVDCTSHWLVPEVGPFDCVFSGPGNGGHIVMHTLNMLEDNFKFVRSILSTKGKFVVSFYNGAYTRSGRIYGSRVIQSAGEYYHWYWIEDYDKNTNVIRHSGLCFISLDEILDEDYDEVLYYDSRDPAKNYDYSLMTYMLQKGGFKVIDGIHLEDNVSFLVTEKV